jgi:folate-binding protein YgfZ
VSVSGDRGEASGASSDLLRRLGGEWLSLAEGIETVARFDSLEEEQKALTSGVGLVIRNWTDHLRVVGADRQTFLNGKVTCELAGLEVGEGAFGFLLDVKGHILSDAIIRLHEREIWLELAAGRGRRILDHLRRFIVVDRVEIETLPDLVPLTLLGPGGRSLLSSFTASGSLPARALEGCRIAVPGDGGLYVSADGRWGAPALTVWSRVARAEDLIGRLRVLGARLVGYQAVDRLRIEAGVPLFGRDFSEANLPQETGLDEAVSYTKGCYLGQEVVARLHYRGQVSRLLCGLRIDASAVPEAGAELVFEGRPAGHLTSCTRSARLGAIVGLAILQRRAVELGTRLEVEGGGSAEVVTLRTGG